MKCIRREDREIHAELMAKKLTTAEAHELLRIRRCSVEPVIGNLKANLGFRRFALRGLSKASGEFVLMAIAHNLNTLFLKGFAELLRPFYTLFECFTDYQRTLCLTANPCY